MLGGVVVNADSMQVYRDLRVLTARPSADEEAAVPHRLYGHVDGATNYSVGRYVADAAAVLADIEEAGQVPIICGGTGLYFRALIDGLSAIPPVPDAVRAALRARTDPLPAPAIHAQLARVDPVMAARLRPTDRLRLQRALEVVEATGRSLASFQGEREAGPLAGRPVIAAFLAPDRDALRARIDARFDAMMAEGALAEVECLMARGLDPARPVRRAPGVPGLIAFLKGEISRDEAIARAKADTRAYAKRQFTWFRNQMPDWPWIDPAEAVDNIVERAGKYFAKT